MGKHFVLVHGAWHGGWCWEGVVASLERAGHTAEAPSMPGHAEADDRAGVTFTDYVDALVDVLARQPSPVVLVGHSSAGFVLQQAAPQAAGKIEQLIFLNAFILPEGTCQFDLVPPEAAAGMTAAAQASPDNCVPVIEDFVRGNLMAGEPAEKQDALLARLCPQPLALFVTPLQAGGISSLDIPKAVVFGTSDASLPPGAFLEMARGLGEYRLVEFKGGHEALFTNPERVADALLEATGVE